jgi:succinoglycan biosynthesis transport protein ExoP
MDAPLNFGRQAAVRLQPESPDEVYTASEYIEQLTGFVRRQLQIFIFITACCLALGFVYLLTTPPKYTAHAKLLIDSSKLRFLQEQQSPAADVPIDAAQVETQVEILKSENIGLSVVKDQKLADDSEFVGSNTGLLGGIMGLIFPRGQQSESGLEHRALATFLAKRSITQVGRTYVLDIGFTSLNAGRSAAIANAIADAYIVDQLEAKYQATKRASVWLQDRIKELRKQATDADRAVLDYKEKNKIVSVGGNSPGGPRLLGEQQLEDLNTQLGTARAAAEDAKAKLERINDVMQRDVPDAAVTDSLHSEVINRLRNQYLDIAAKEAIWAAKYGENHLAAVNLRTQMFELSRSIHDELGRIAESYKSDYEIAKTRVDGLERELQKLVASSQVVNRDRLGLTDLESTAKVYHSIYDNFLQRYMEAIQQQSFPMTEARVISAAAPPEHKSSPLAPIVLGIAGIMGLALSFGVAFLRDTIDRVFRSVRQVEGNLRVRCLAVLPMLAGPGSVRSRRSLAILALKNAALGGAKPATARPRADSEPERRVPTGEMVETAQRAQRNLRGTSSKQNSGQRSIAPTRPFMRQVIDEPLSPFAEAFRSIKVAADISGSSVIGITSTVPAEGKSTVSSNLAQLMAHAGKRVILLDGDLRNPSLTRSLARGARVGLIEVLSGQAPLDSAIYIDEITGLRFLPGVVNSPLTHSDEILASDSFKSFVNGLRQQYDYVLIDFSPIAPIVDVRATTQVIDSYMYVIEWGKTQISFVQHELSRFPELHDRLLGVVLNKADVRVLDRYETYYYGKRYYGGQYRYGSAE